MRKILLFVAITMAVINVQAQTWTSPASWTKTIDAYTEECELGQPIVETDADGNVVVAGIYDKTFTFGATTVDNADAMASSFIAKYAADGTEQWAVSLYGACEIASVDSDEAGNIYLTGEVKDEVVFGSVDGNAQTVKSEGTSVAFVAKYDKAGNIKTVRTIAAEADADLMATGLYYPEISVETNKIQVTGDKVYVSAAYYGNVNIDNLKWQGRVIDVFGFMFMDIASVGVMSFDTDLQNAQNVVTIQATTDKSDVQQCPESINFTAAGNTVYVSAVAYGAQTITTANATENVTFESDAEGNIEHGIVVCNIDPAKTTTKVFHSATHGKYYTDYISGMYLDGGNLYIMGTFYGTMHFNNDVKVQDPNAVFVANLNPETLAVNWATTDGKDEAPAEGATVKNIYFSTVNNGSVYMTVADDESAYAYNVTADGAMTADALENDFENVSDNGKGQVATVSSATETYVVSMFGAPVDGIGGVETTVVANDKVYNINGQAVQNMAQKGIYIVGGKKVVVK